MGLTLKVKTTSGVLFQSFAFLVQKELKSRLHYTVPTRNPFPGGYESDDLPWSGWASLQKLAASTVGEANVPHLLAVEAWLGVYLPIPINPTQILIQWHSEPHLLQCASLIELVKELEHFARVQSLPITPKELEEAKARFEELWIAGIEEPPKSLQTYVELMLCARVAVEHSMPLWVVK